MIDEVDIGFAAICDKMMEFNWNSDRYQLNCVHNKPFCSISMPIPNKSP